MKFWKTHQESILNILVFTLVLGWVSNSVAAKSNHRNILFEDLPVLVNEKNEKIAAAKLNIKAQDERTGILGRSFLPQVSVAVGQEQFKSDIDPALSQEYWKLETSINIYKGGRDSVEDKLQNAVLDLTKTEADRVSQNELKMAKQEFWKIVSLNQLILDRKEALQKNELNLKSAKKRAGAGIVTTADGTQFELHQISIEREITNLKLEKEKALNRLKVILSIEESESIDIDGDFPKQIEQGFDANQPSSDQHTEVKIQKNLEQVELLKTDYSARWWLPKVDLYSNYGLPSLTENYDHAQRKSKEWNAGVRMIFDLGQGFEDRQESIAKKMEAEAMGKKVNYAIRNGQALEKELRYELSILRELIKATEQDTKTAQNFLKLTESEYMRGVKNGPDLLEAVQKYFTFRDRRIEYNLKFFTAKSELESLSVAIESKK